MSDRNKESLEEVNDVTADIAPDVALDVKEEEFIPRDGGFGWIVCVSSMWAGGTSYGIVNVFGIMYVTLLEKYKDTETDIAFKTSLIGSLSGGFLLLLSPVASILIDKIGIRKTGVLGSTLLIIGLVSSAFVENLEYYYLTFGILYGCGASMTYTPSIIILGHYFKKRLGIVNGLVTFGAPFFSVILSQVIPLLLRHSGLRWTFLFLAGLSFITMLCTLTWKSQYKSELSVPDDEEKNSQCQCLSKYINFEIWRNKRYLIWLLSEVILYLAAYVPLVHLVRHSEDVFPTYDGSLLILCMAIGSGVGRLMSGKLADFKCTNNLIMQQCSFAVFGLITTCIPFASHFYALIFLTLVLGLCDGFYSCLLGPIAFKLLGPNGAAQGMGFLFGLGSLTISAGPPLVGLMYDKLGSYKIAFHSFGIIGFLAAFCMCFVTKRSYQRKRVYVIE